MNPRNKFLQLENNLNEYYIGDLLPVPRLLNLSILTGGPFFLHGEPGTGKSSIIRSYCLAFPSLSSFILSGSAFSEKSDLVGPKSIKEYRETDKLVHNIEGTVVTEDLIFLDECLEIGEKVIKVLYPLMVEEEFPNGTEKHKTQWLLFVGGSNKKFRDLKESSGFIDRFLLRHFLSSNLDSKQLQHIRKINRERRLRGEKIPKLSEVSITRDEILQARKELLNISISEFANKAIESLFIRLKDRQRVISMRRWGLIDQVLQASAWLRGSEVVEEEDISSLINVFAENPEDFELFEKDINACAYNPVAAARELVRESEKIMKKVAQLDLSTKDGALKHSEYHTALAGIKREMVKLQESLRDRHKNPAVLNDYAEKINQSYASILGLVMTAQRNFRL